VRQSPASKDVNTEVKVANVFGSRYQSTTCEDPAGSEVLLRAVMNYTVCELAIAL
jgi:hypothetical protein